jgi:hypothetical protein
MVRALTRQSLAKTGCQRSGDIRTISPPLPSYLVVFYLDAARNLVDYLAKMRAKGRVLSIGPKNGLTEALPAAHDRVMELSCLLRTPGYRDYYS